MGSMSNDTGDGPLMTALASPFFAAVAGGGGMLYAWHQYEDFLRQADFTQIEQVHLPEALTPHGIIVATR